jgi:eukaryotic-like serine/threonine-protein kinase
MGDEPTAMTPAPSEQSVFAEALRRDTAEARDAYLDGACGTDIALRRRVEALLRAAENAGDFLEEPPTGLGGDTDSTLPVGQLSEKPGDRIGRYKLLQQIGEGGCGVVYMAEQLEPVRRRVALKVIKLGMDTKNVIARFEAERQALALMDHPNIAKIYDAGVTEAPLPSSEGRARHSVRAETLPPDSGAQGTDAPYQHRPVLSAGRPYFVMELVRGIKITDYCDQNNLSTQERLKLFMQVCAAIQHAHQKGIIHRDIKPSNILVTQNESVAVPKVIDFGIAKATTDQRLTDKTVFTAFEQFIGTPAYMSPEQAMMTSLDIDTRTDIYALGVLLYELLTGKTPFDAKELMAVGLDAMRRTIREQEPARPSTRLSTMLAVDLTAIATHRHCEPAKLGPLLRGDLDWIVMKALEKDRTRRYETANGLAMDVQRHLNDEPIVARPPSRLYEFQKTVRRHKFGFAAAAAVILALAVGFGIATWTLIKEKEARVRAVAAVEAERLAKETAQEREAEIKAVLDFVENKVFAAARPEAQDGGLGQDVMLRQAIEAALPFVDQGFTNQPLIEARLRMTVGWTFWCLGEPAIAAEQFQTARGLYTRLLGADHPDTLRSMNNLANAYGDLGRNDESLKLHEETLARRKVVLGPDHPDTLFSMNNVAFGYATAKRFDEAIQLGLEALARRSETLGPDHPHTLMSRMVLARSYAMAGRYAEAAKFGEVTLALQEAKLGRHHPYTLRSMSNQAFYYSRLGREADALKLREELMPLLKAQLGADHPVTIKCMMALAASYTFAGREAEALKLRNEALAISKAKLGPVLPDTLDNMPPKP